MASSQQPEDESAQLVSEYLASGKDSLNVVVCGKIGVGKSSLVNGLVGRQVAEECMSAVSQTLEITPYRTEIKVSVRSRIRPIQTTIWDTPGYADVFLDEATCEANSDEIAEKCREADLLLYCMKMCDRLTIDDTIGIEELTKRVGPEVWKNAVFVLTFANEVKPSRGQTKDTLEHFEHIFSSWQSQLKMVLTKRVSLPENIVRSISIIPTGYRQTPPPDRDDWLSPFWFEAFCKTKESAQPALLGINLHRLRIQSPYQATAARSLPREKQLKEHEQTININPQDVGKAEKRGGEIAGREALSYIFNPIERAVGEAIQKISQRLMTQAVDATTKQLVPTVVTAVLAASGWQIAAAAELVGAGIGVGALVYAVVVHKAKKRAEIEASMDSKK